MFIQLRLQALCVLMLAAGYLRAQEYAFIPEEDTPTETASHQYKIMTTGFGLLSFRDFATSPLIYSGPAFQTAFGRLKTNDTGVSTGISR